MMTLEELRAFLKQENCDFELLAEERLVLTAADGTKRFAPETIAPVFILESNKGFYALILQGARGRIDFPLLKKLFGFSKLKMASPESVEKQTGYFVGSVPLVGHGLPCIFDNALCRQLYIYGGSGDANHTLKISPWDVIRCNQVAYCFE